MQDFNYEFLKLDFKRQVDFSLSENVVCDPVIHHSNKSNNTFCKSNIPALEQRYSIKPPTAVTIGIVATSWRHY